VARLAEVWAGVRLVLAPDSENAALY
jgi:hypothetical protein